MRGAWTVTLGGRSYVSRPVSAEAVAAFLDAAAADPASAERALRVLLRRAFPRAWYQRVLRRRSVADRVLDLPPAARAAAMTALLRPPKPREAERAPDPWDALAAQNTAPDAPAARATLTVRHALAQCERFYGAAWAWNPARWGTDDGIVPYPVLWEAWHRMQAIAALERLSATSAAARAHGGEAAQAACDADARRAYEAADPAPVVIDLDVELRRRPRAVVTLDGRDVAAHPLDGRAVRRFLRWRYARVRAVRRLAQRRLLADAFPHRPGVVTALMRADYRTRERVVATLLAVHRGAAHATEAARG